MLPVSAILGSLVVMLRGSGYLEPLLLLLLILLILLLPTRVASATASATTTCDEDQRACRDACETELEEAAASYLFPRLHRPPPSSLLKLEARWIVSRLLYSGVSKKTPSRKLAEQARLPTPRYRVGMRMYECRLPRRTLLGFSLNKSLMRVCC